MPSTCTNYASLLSRGNHQHLRLQGPSLCHGLYQWPASQARGFSEDAHDIYLAQRRLAQTGVLQSYGGKRLVLETWPSNLKDPCTEMYDATWDHSYIVRLDIS